VSDEREDKSQTPRDWRGTEILIGAPVIYGGPVGRSIQLVGGEVVGFTKAGRVNVKVIRRAYSEAYYGDKRVVHVGMDRLIVLNPDSLPPTALPTWEEAIDTSAAERDERDRRSATHTWPPEVLEDVTYGSGPNRVTYHNHRSVQPPCTVCGLGTFEGSRQECVVPA